MSGHFAGSAGSHDRRRRSLSHDLPDPSESILHEYRLTQEPTLPETAGLVRAPDYFVTRLISPRRWKHLAAIAVAGAVCLLIVLLFARTPDQSPDGFAHAGRQRIADCVAGGLILLTGQLAILTGWIRGRSEVDFQGTYRAWKWAGTLLLFVGSVITADVSGNLTDLALTPVQTAVGSVQAARPVILLLPTLIIGLLVTSRVWPDMGRNRIAQTLTSAGLLGAAGLMMDSVPAIAARTSPMTLTAFRMLFAFGLFSGLLHHVRFVLYVNNDPPLRRLRTVKKRVSENAAGDVPHSETQVTTAERADGPDRDDAVCEGAEASDNAQVLVSGPDVPTEPGAAETGAVAECGNGPEPRESAKSSRRSDARQTSSKRKLRKAG